MVHAGVAIAITASSSAPFCSLLSLGGFCTRPCSHLSLVVQCPALHWFKFSSFFLLILRHIGGRCGW